MTDADKAGAQPDTETGAAPPLPDAVRRPHGWFKRWPIIIVGLAVLVAAVDAGIYYFISGNGKPQSNQEVAVATTPAEAPTSAAPAGTSALSVLQPNAAASAAPAASAPPGIKVSTRSFEDWVVVCPAEPAVGAPCVAQQQLVASGGGAVFIWTIEKDRNGVLHAAWRTPTGIALIRGLTIDIGDGAPKTVPFSTCDTRLCTARAVLAADYLAKLEAAGHLSAAVVIDDTGKPYTFALSSRGLTDALAQLSVNN
jgi:invasion protein IalB